MIAVEILGCVLILTVVLLVMWRRAEHDATTAHRRVDELEELTGRQRARIRHQRRQICKYLDELDAAARGQQAQRDNTVLAALSPDSLTDGPPVIPGRPAFTDADLATALAALEELPLTSPEDTR